MYIIRNSIYVCVWYTCVYMCVVCMCVYDARLYMVENTIGGSIKSPMPRSIWATVEIVKLKIHEI